VQAFVTGGTGFIGANLVRLMLKQGYQVRVLVRPQSTRDNLKGLDVEMVTGNITDPGVVKHLRGCQVLFHVAAHYSLWQTDQDQLYRSNVLGTRSILKAARDASIERTVYTSSVAAIGVPESGAIATETYQSSIDKLVGAYKQSKYLAEQEARHAISIGQDIVIVNPSTPVGSWDLKPTPTGDMILRFLRRQMPFYLNTGLNLIHVRDVAQGHLLALEKGKTGDRYILGNRNLTLQEILAYLSQITGLPEPRGSLPAWIPLTAAWIDECVLAPLGKRPSVPLAGVKMAKQKMFYDASKAVQELGLPQTEIDLALRDAVDWFISHDYVPNWQR
jgi:dihydroflavonol-4-reductase